jgi:hypothetical protein
MSYSLPNFGVNTHNLTGVSDRSRPVEALEERVAHEGARRHVVTTHVHVDVAEELAPQGHGYSPLQDA